MTPDDRMEAVALAIVQALLTECHWRYEHTGREGFLFGRLLKRVALTVMEKESDEMFKEWAVQMQPLFQPMPRQQALDRSLGLMAEPDFMEAQRRLLDHLQGP